MDDKKAAEILESNSICVKHGKKRQYNYDALRLYSIVKHPGQVTKEEWNQSINQCPVCVKERRMADFKELLVAKQKMRMKWTLWEWLKAFWYWSKEERNGLQNQ